MNAPANEPTPREAVFRYGRDELRVSEEVRDGRIVGLWVIDEPYGDIDLTPDSARDLWPLLKAFAETGRLPE